MVINMDLHLKISDSMLHGEWCFTSEDILLCYKVNEYGFTSKDNLLCYMVNESGFTSEISYSVTWYMVLYIRRYPTLLQGE